MIPITTLGDITNEKAATHWVSATHPRPAVVVLEAFLQFSHIDVLPLLSFNFFQINSFCLALFLTDVFKVSAALYLSPTSLYSPMKGNLSTKIDSIIAKWFLTYLKKFLITVILCKTTYEIIHIYFLILIKINNFWNLNVHPYTTLHPAVSLFSLGKTGLGSLTMLQPDLITKVHHVSELKQQNPIALTVCSESCPRSHS